MAMRYNGVPGTATPAAPDKIHLISRNEWFGRIVQLRRHEGQTHSNHALPNIPATSEERAWEQVKENNGIAQLLFDCVGIFNKVRELYNPLGNPGNCEQTYVYLTCEALHGGELQLGDAFNEAYHGTQIRQRRQDELYAIEGIPPSSWVAIPLLSFGEALHGRASSITVQKGDHHYVFVFGNIVD
eukprot:TRINITY_DN4220_c0_g1_i1.p1 TRINITY_DN4220_c0_g1~~TRINITY_DN4220_c0_g1_i1.p1  ORF type:complete len:185 (-),score=16.49 TRINITY_DN4220_c0_g1_i1:533-1087(-)